MSSPSTKYYKTDSTKITFREYWKSGFSRPRILIVLLLKSLGIPLALRQNIPWPLRLRDTLINEAELPLLAKEKIAPSLEDCKRLGFRVLCFQTIKQLLPSEIAVVSLLHPNNEIAARIFFVRVTTPKVVRDHLHCFMESWLNDGVFLLTSNSNEKLILDHPPDHDVLRLADAQPGVLFEAHMNRLSRSRANNSPRLIRCLEDFEKMVDALDESEFRFNAGRGIFVEMTPEEINKATSLAGTSEQGNSC